TPRKSFSRPGSKPKYSSTDPACTVNIVTRFQIGVPDTSSGRPTPGCPPAWTPFNGSMMLASGPAETPGSHDGSPDETGSASEVACSGPAERVMMASLPVSAGSVVGK